MDSVLETKITLEEFSNWISEPDKVDEIWKKLGNWSWTKAENVELKVQQQMLWIDNLMNIHF